MFKGIDVSKHQGFIDWEKVKASGVQFAILRAGYGKNASQKDPQFDTNYVAAKAAGIPVGAYHYSYAQSVEDAKKEAAFFLDIIKGKQFEYPVMFDIEDASQVNLGKDLLTQIVLTFCDTVEKAGYYTMIYANLDWVQNRLDMSVLERFDLWLAKWGTEAAYKGNYGIWQYSSEGTINGISNRVDMDIAYKDYPETIKALGLNGYQKPTVPQPAPNQSQSTATAPKPQPASVNLYAKGRKISLSNVPLYASSDASKPSVIKSGVFYLYDGKEFASGAYKRYRITNNANLSGITGYINKSDIK